MINFPGDSFKVPEKYIANLKSVTGKVRTLSNLELKQWERIMISSCTNERLSILNSLNDELGVNDLMDFYGALKPDLVEIDTAYSVLEKVENGRYKSLPRYKERTSYMEYFESIEKLKQSEMIYLSGSKGVSPYKIGFVYKEAEYCSFELRRGIDLQSIFFTPLNDDAVRYGYKFFQQVLRRGEAFDNLNQFDDSEYREGQLPFLLRMLN